MSVILTSASPMCKTFSDSPLPERYAAFSVLRGECAAFQLAFAESDASAVYPKQIYKLRITSSLAADITASKIEDVPVRMPMYKNRYDGNYLRCTPGLYPDLLIPLEKGDCTDSYVNFKTQLYVVPGETRSVYVEIDINDSTPAGDYAVKCELCGYDGVAAEAIVSVHVVGASLPVSEMSVTQWFYTDCLMNYYRTDAFSEEYWRITENYVRCMVRNGIDTVLTPCFTPPLDTAVGGERPTVQLVDVTVGGDGGYTFGFEKFERWVEMCLRQNVRHLEINHLFTQWGATHAPKIMADTPDGYRRIFGWETDAHGDEYAAFLEAFLCAMREELDRLGVRGMCYWHVSDEPGKDNLADYMRSKERIIKYMDDAYIMDALSDVSFYTSGAVDHPIPSNNHIEPFLEAGVPGLWTYYCCGQCVDVSNRFIAMPSCRTRVIGEQFYKYKIAGFLQWGFNFWNNQYSIEPINPFLCTDGEYFAPAGDAFSVYPAPDGTAYESLRIRMFYAALCDVRAFKLCESFYGRETVLREIERGIEPIKFDSYPKNEEYIINLRERINRLIELKV